MTTFDLEQLAGLLGDGGMVETDVPLGHRTTYRVGGTGAVVVTLLNVAAAEAFADWLPESVPVAVLGNGSNVLVADEGFSGITVHLAGQFDDIVLEGSLVTCGGGADLPKVARRSVEAALTGFEWAVGVPGTVGGALMMNAGGHGSSIEESLKEATVLNLRTGVLSVRSVTEFSFGYRHSNLHAHEVVLFATFALATGNREAGLEQLKDIVAWRRAHQPGGQNCGSVFVNPPKAAAGQLIEACGLRGRRHGTAEVSEKHANFIQADPDGLAADVIALIGEVANEVRAKRGLSLSTDLKVLSDHPEHLPSLLRSVTS
ncbi:MAG: UDP-N-acetylmuramate dehydrogenase [Actinomycetes bacterium]